MKLYVSYASSWRGQMLEGNNSKDWFNRNRKVIRKGDLKSGFVPYDVKISNNTILGIIYRLVGEQRRLWRVLETGEYLGISGKIDFIDNINFISREAVALREIGSAMNPMGWSGIAKSETSNYFTNPNLYQTLIFPLVCSPSQLYDLIVNNKFGKASNTSINGRLDVLRLIDRIDNSKINDFTEDQICCMFDTLKNKFPKTKYQSKDVNKYSVFCLSAMFLCAEHLVGQGHKETGVKWNKGGGIGPRGATPKEFFSAITNGRNTVITFPMDDNWKRKTKKIEKPTGQLEITIDISKERAQEIKSMIESANVGCFSVGKKGLAYLSHISIY